MSFNEQDRYRVVTLSEAKGLSMGRRCFASLSMTFPVLGGKPHYRAPGIMINYLQGNTLRNISRISTGLDIGGIAHGNYR